MTEISRKTPSKTAKILVAVCSLGGVVFSLFRAKNDGYSHWGRRLLYFTAQSNIWIGAIMLILLLFPRKFQDGKWGKRLYALKYNFTVSITVTGLVFCGLLAPFSDEGYVPWTFVNLLTHVFSPAFAIADFYLDEMQPPITKKQVFYSLLPPLIYCAFASVVGALEVDFGRGVPYPYFFLNYRSPAGFFGFSDQRPFFVGEFYWLAALAIVVLAIALLYAHTRNPRRKISLQA